MKPPNYRHKLEAAQQRTGSWLCVGLDPDPAKMPDLPALQGPDKLVTFCRAIVEATEGLACAYKPNLGFFLAQGVEGLQALQEVMSAIPQETPVLIDAKLGDISSTQRAYGQAVFARLGADAVTVSPYVGEDAVLPLVEDYAGCGVYVLARTSNPGASRFQDHGPEGSPLYHEVVRTAQGWASEHPRSTIGLVVGATYPNDLKTIREIAPALPFLIPGVGAQGGALEAAARFGPTADGIGPLISSSRAILYASGGEDYAEAARRVATTIRDNINRLRTS